MDIERREKKFIINMNLTEMLTLYTIVSEEKITAVINRFDFQNQKSVKKALAEFHAKFQELVDLRTPKEKDKKFFR